MSVNSKVYPELHALIQGVPEFFEQNVTKCFLQLYKDIELHKGMSESV